jgi:polyphosphate kinase 2 (PPK2 family)
VIVFEGRDAAGKGGTIRRFREHLNPRGARRPTLSAGWSMTASCCSSCWLAVNRDEQRRRLKARMDDPLKTWKLSPIDHTSLEHWDGYTEAADPDIVAPPG